MTQIDLTPAPRHRPNCAHTAQAHMVTPGRAGGEGCPKTGNPWASCSHEGVRR